MAILRRAADKASRIFRRSFPGTAANPATPGGRDNSFRGFEPPKIIERVYNSAHSSTIVIEWFHCDASSGRERFSISFVGVFHINEHLNWFAPIGCAARSIKGRRGDPGATAITRIREENAAPPNLHFRVDDVFAVFPCVAGNQFRIEYSLGKANEFGGIFNHEVRHDRLVFCLCIHNCALRIRISQFQGTRKRAQLSSLV
jgi:hypothetical protein